MTQRLLLCAVIFLLSASTSRADRVYRLVDYPANQATHSLKGTITTSDDAVLDSLLDTGEILSWQWSITGPNSFSASSLEFTNNKTMALGVKITPKAIILPLADSTSAGPMSFELARETPQERGPIGHRLGWVSLYDTSTGTINFDFANRLQGDAVQNFWVDFSTFLPNDTWVIAVAVPEPTGAILLAMALIMLAARSR